MSKKTLLSITLVSLVALGAVSATLAYFVATRTTSANKFTAGTLDLNVTANGNALEPFVIENMGDNANISGTKTWAVKNTGTLPGRLLVRLQNVVNKENGCANDQETTADPTCGNQGKEGNLGGVINLKVALDGTDKVESSLATANLAKIGNDWNALTPIVLAPNETRNITAHWAADETQYGNEIQGDSIEFDANFRLIQIINGPTPSN